MTSEPRPPGTRRSHRWVVIASLVVGTGALFVLMRLDARDGRFALVAAGAAVIWFAGAWLARPVPVRGAYGTPRTIGLGVGAGLLAAAACLTVGLGAAQVTLLREPAEDLLAHTATGTAMVLAVTLLNGVAEEFFFRGALYDVLSPRHALLGSTGLYVLTTLGTGVLLLPAAALLLGLVTAALRRLTGGVLAPAAAHVTWSIVMITVLPSVLETGR